MFEQIIWYLKGYVRIRVIGYSPERFLNACRYKNIYIWDLKRICGAYEMNITIEGFRRLKDIVRKTDTKICIIRRNGLPFLLHRYRKRHLFLYGFLLCIFLILFLTRYIWGIDIRGNLAYTEDTLKKFLASEQIENGMKKSDVNCQKIVHDLREKYDGIIWASASVEGCRLIIQVKENEDGLSGITELHADDTANTDIVADTDCRVTDIITRTGIPLVHEGTQVKKGEILVSGQIPVCNDAKEITGYTPCRSDADIYGEMIIPYQKTISTDYIKKEYYASRYHFVQKRIYTIRMHQHYLTIGSEKNDYPFFEKNTVQKKLHLINICSLTIEKNTITPYRKTHKKYTKSEICRILSADFRNYCKEMEKKGVEIIQNDVKIYTGSETYRAKGTLKIRRSIGRQVPSTPLPAEKLSEEETKNGD